jgi:two-component system, NtrC family, response regulator PilR
MSRPLALVVDDEADILDLIRITLGRMDVSAVTALTVAEAKRNWSAIGPISVSPI